MGEKQQRAALLLGLILLSFSATPAAWAGAWTVPQNHWYSEYFFRVFHAKKFFDPDGESHRLAKGAFFHDIRHEGKLEYGVTDWLNLLASVPLQFARYRDDDVDLHNSGIGDIYLRTKIRFFNKPVVTDKEPLVASAQFSWKIPSAYDRNKSPGFGDGQFDYESRLQLSQSWVFSPYEVRTPPHQRPSPQPIQTKPQASQPSDPMAGREAAIRQAVLAAKRSLPHHERDPQTAHVPDPAQRETAIQRAMLTAKLYQQGLYFAEAGLHREAAECFRGVLEKNPSHDEATRRLFDEVVAMAEDATESPAQVRTVAYERLEPVLPRPSETRPSETEIRYARVAFINLEGGFTARRGAPANEFPMLLECGVTPVKRLMLVGSVESVISVKSTHEQTEDFAKWGVRAIVNLWGDGFASVFRTGEPTVNFEVGYNDVFAGRNTDDAWELFGKIGIFF